MWHDFDAEIPEDNPGYHDQVWRLRELQGDRCAICDDHHGMDLVLDHDHKTGLTRGLLCRSCNTSLGISGATSASRKRYLAKPPAAKLGWYYETAFGTVPPRSGDYVVDMDKMREAINSLTFDPPDTDSADLSSES